MKPWPRAGFHLSITNSIQIGNHHQIMYFGSLETCLPLWFSEPLVKALGKRKGYFLTRHMLAPPVGTQELQHTFTWQLLKPGKPRWIQKNVSVSTHLRFPCKLPVGPRGCRGGCAGPVTTAGDRRQALSTEPMGEGEYAKQLGSRHLSNTGRAVLLMKRLCGSSWQAITACLYRHKPPGTEQCGLPTSLGKALQSSREQSYCQLFL